MTRNPCRRRGITLFQLLIVLAILAILLGLLLPAVQKVREAAARTQSMNNLKQLTLGLHNYNDTYGLLPPGVDDNKFSAASKLLPFIEQQPLFNRIDFKKSIDDEANAPARGIVVKTFISPTDPAFKVKDEWGATNYLFNDQVFFLNSTSKIPNTFTDGTSNTIAIGETLKGDGGTKAMDVHRQHVLLGKDALKGIKPDAGVQDWKDGKHIAGDRCASWMDGRFLQGTFNGALKLNDERPDVSCAGLGGVSTLRTYEGVVLVSMADGSVRSLSPRTLTLATFQAALTPSAGDILGPDW
jgi:type II secretory pathway pseudopilin PulG